MEVDDEVDLAYLRKINAVLCGYPTRGSGRPQNPTQLLSHLYIGNQDNARNTRLIRSLGITHVLNCAAVVSRDRDTKSLVYDKDSGIQGYQEFAARDHVKYHIMQHFDQAKAFLDHVKEVNGKVLVHCAQGINRSGAICVAYMMIDQWVTLLQALKKAKRMRTMLLTNRGFRKQLIQFARAHDLLDDPDVDVTEL